MKYDPILCMMVDDSVKMKDSKAKGSKLIDKAIRSCDSREEDIADELFDALQQIGKRNINKAEAEFLAEEFFDDEVSANELMRIFNKYKREYL